MRKSLASHARERMFLEEQRGRRSMLEQLGWPGVLADNRPPIAFDIPAPEATALRQRAENAERIARTWHRLAMLLVVVLLIVVAQS